MSGMSLRTIRATAAAVVFASAALAASPSLAQTILRMNNWLPPGHSQFEQVMKPWVESVKEATGGRVEIQFTDASLGAPPRQFDLAVDGIADVVISIGGYTPGRFPLLEIAELPFISENAEATSIALWNLHNELFAEKGEFRDVELLGLYSQGSVLPMTTARAGAITDLASWAGKKLRVGGGIVTDINSSLGGVNVSAPANEVYEMLSTGIADGTLLPPEAYPSFNLSGTIAHLTEIPGGFASSAWFVAMNKDAWARISPEDQEAIRNVSGEALARLGGGVFDAVNAAGTEKMKADGVQIHTLDDASLAEVKDRLAYLEEKWIAAAQAKGIDGVAALKTLRDNAAQLAGN